MTSPCQNQARNKISFQRKGKGKVARIKGTRPSIHNSLLLISSGVPSFDYVLGGGLAVGSILLIEEDIGGNYARLLLRYFLAEGVTSGHNLFLCGTDENPKDILQVLPYPVESEKLLTSSSSGSTPSDCQPMKIAWRYENLPTGQQAPTSNQFGHSYDLSRVMTSDLLDQVRSSTYYLPDEEQESVLDSSSTCNICPPHKRLLQRIEREIKDGGFHLQSSSKVDNNTQERTVLRIGIHSFGSPYWCDDVIDDTGQSLTSLCLMLHALRALLRSSLAVAVITIPSHLFSELSHVKRLGRLCDTVVHLESFAGSAKETNLLFQDYHGLFHVKQLPRLNSLALTTPDTTDLAFKLKRKKFTIEKLHLPPEFSESASRAQEDAALPAFSLGSSGCSSNLKSQGLDF